MNYFLTNTTKTTFLAYIKDALSTCDAFYFSVSFIKKAGLTLIEDDILRALRRGAKGSLITSTYQNFTDIKSLQTLLAWKKTFEDFDCHLDHQSFGDRGFHSKGYLFAFPDRYEIAIGSSNLTLYALKKNVEWNLMVSSIDAGGSYQDALLNYQLLWEQTYPLEDELIKSYQNDFEYAIDRWDMDYVHVFQTIEPNFMQRKALKEIRRYRDLGIDKALVVAATGSGKTHLAAFDAKHFDAARVLFVVHRENILVNARKIFQQIMGPQYTTGLFTGHEKVIDADLVFATNLTLAKNLDVFDPVDFDYIILDEVHHAAAETYQRIIEYFKPLFLLGLTATPERTDDVDAIYDLFDERVPFDLRLRDAIINELVVPFKYYGIRNQLLSYDQREERTLVHQMRDPDNVDFIDLEIRKHLPKGKLKAIAFCMNIGHAKAMADEMRLRGYHTRDLVGHHSVGERLKAFQDLQDENHPLQIIFAVDILNEGIDIPAINMVLFLRPTESSIVFLQQLGRGLRLYPNKAYLTVLDFIGNAYKRSVQIARALGTLSRSTIIEKKLLVDLVRDDYQSLEIPGVEVHIDPLSKEEIIDHIQKTNFNLTRYLKNDYQTFKTYIHAPTYPTHMDYYNNDFAPDLIRFIRVRMNGIKNGSYYAFLKKIGEKVPDFSEQQMMLLSFASGLLPLVRREEFDILSYLIDEEQAPLKSIQDHLSMVSGLNRPKHVKSAINTMKKFLEGMFYENMIDGKHHYILNLDRNDHVFINHLQDLIAYGLSCYDDVFGAGDHDLKPYVDYTTEQFMMATCQSDVYVYQKGTKIESDGTIYILAQLKKGTQTLDHLKYEDRFMSPTVFQWESETRTTMTSARGQKLINAKTVHLLIRKTKEEDGITLPYTYIGTGQMTNPRASDNSEKTLLFDIVLDQALPQYLQYDFLLKGTNDEDN